MAPKKWIPANVNAGVARTVSDRIDEKGLVTERPASAEPADTGSENTVYNADIHPTLRMSDEQIERLRNVDREFHARLGGLTGGLSFIGLADAWTDWYLHLAIAPGKQIELAARAAGKWQRILSANAECVARGDDVPPCVEPLPHDKRFDAKDWNTYPYNIIYQSFLLSQQWWHRATTSVPGVARRNEHIVEFYTRQMLDMFAPSNSLATNPELLKQTIEEGGLNLVRGYGYFLDDLNRAAAGQPPAGVDRFTIGEDIAATPGSVVFRNDLIELIQYAPVTKMVHSEPILIVPAWIMKYYILDLSPENSLIGYMVSKGFTVFCISWKNPDSQDRDLSLDDYMHLGVMDALDAVERISGSRRVHATGYCLGGTLLTIAAAAMARAHDDRLASISLFAAQADFTEAGELSLFITESQLSLIEDMMWKEGYLDQSRMAGAFKFLRSQDLIWSRTIREYLMGEREPMTDLGAWNADATRMPYRMHSEYLRKLYLNNDFAEGRLVTGGHHVFPQDISGPVFAVATEHDHIAPWGSVFKLTRILACDVTFVLASGGHNTGIVAPPAEEKASFKVLEHRDGENHPPPGKWADDVQRRRGSWWEFWAGWLAEKNKTMTVPPPMGERKRGGGKLDPAPGKYVHIK